MTEYRNKSGYDGIGTPLKLGKELPPASDDDLTKIVLGRPDPRDLSQLAQTTARIEAQLQQESKERQAADEKNRRESRKWNIVTLVASLFGGAVGSLVLQWINTVWPSVCEWFIKLS